MELLPINHPVWKKIVKGEVTCDFEFLATKIFLGRARMVLFNDDSPKAILLLAEQMRGIFESNLTHPTIIRDIEKLSQCKWS